MVLVLEHCDSGDMHHILQKHRNRVISERHVVVKVLVPLLTALQVRAHFQPFTAVAWCWLASWLVTFTASGSLDVPPIWC